MPTGILRPSNQVKHTNLAVVRIKKGKKRFEVACYPNKVLDFRAEVETDIDNVLQAPYIYFNSSAGEVAPKAEIAKAWPDKSDEDIIKFILQKGELQVAAKERQAILERIRNEVIEFVAANVVDPRTKRVYTPGMIEKALDQLSVQSSRQQQEKNSKVGKADTEGAGAAAKKGKKGKGNKSTALEDDMDRLKLDSDDDDWSTGKNNKKGKRQKQTKNKAEPREEEIQKPAKPTTEAPEEDEAEPEHEEDEKVPKWTGVVISKPAKPQALLAIKALEHHQPIPVMRARMKLRIICPAAILKHIIKLPSKTTDAEGAEKKEKKVLHEAILALFDHDPKPTEETHDEEVEITGFAAPSSLKPLNDLMGGMTKGRGRVEVLEQAIKHEEN
ncbi:SBDS-domain-containing protein [Sporormia fimetaria CBS 119925]|uniref:SBDS-domain-containing protein n=1 Tax=Sporormia fimetaria CBS 119925 TaxID=1340428 RepID=A0A6A6V482_9PLEO|nr:SBDS-domain-containing protein [Sporormia fimetaria CBS 119925]